MFDCILPRASTKRRVAFTSIGKLQMRRGKYKLDDSALIQIVVVPVVQVIPGLNLHHLTKANEILGWQLMAIHNLKFYHRLMADMHCNLGGSLFKFI